jgi:hypothetical protein
MTFYHHIIWSTPPPCKKNKRKRYALFRVHSNNKGWIREREREIFNWLVVDYFGDTDLNFKFPKATLISQSHFVIVLDHLVCNGSRTSTIEKNALSTYTHMAIIPKSKLLAHHTRALY